MTKPFPKGRGPFVIFAAGEVFAVDLGTPGSNPVSLGLVVNSYATPSVYGNGYLIPVLADDDSISLVSREGIRRAVVRPDHRVKALSVSPESRWLAIAEAHESDYSARISIYPVDVPLVPKHLDSFETAGDQGDMFQVLWSTPSKLTMIDVCHCDGGPGYTNTYTLSLTGQRKEETFLGESDPYQVGPQIGGPLFVYNGTPRVDCFEIPDPCTNLLNTLYVADADARSLRPVASRRKIGFGSPQISPNGSLVAALIDRDLVVYDVRTKEVVAHRNDSMMLRPLGWIHNELLIAAADTSDGHFDALWMVKVDRRLGRLEIASLVRGTEPYYLGFIR